MFRLPGRIVNHGGKLPIASIRRLIHPEASTKTGRKQLAPTHSRSDQTPDPANLATTPRSGQKPLRRSRESQTTHITHPHRSKRWIQAKTEPPLQAI